MKRIVSPTLLVAAVLFATHALSAAEKAAPKMTCCQEARKQGKECSHNCCVNAHRKGESCTKCNPKKEDLEKDPKAEARKEGSRGAK
jgi:hypothetical protein